MMSDVEMSSPWCVASRRRLRSSFDSSCENQSISSPVSSGLSFDSYRLCDKCEKPCASNWNGDVSRCGRTKLFVGSIAAETTEEELEEMFAAYGEIREVKVLTDKGRPKYSAFVNMKRACEASEAVKALNHSRTLPGARRILEVRIAERNGAAARDAAKEALRNHQLQYSSPYMIDMYPRRSMDYCRQTILLSDELMNTEGYKELSPKNNNNTAYNSILDTDFATPQKKSGETSPLSTAASPDTSNREASLCTLSSFLQDPGFSNFEGLTESVVDPDINIIFDALFECFKADTPNLTTEDFFSMRS